MELAARDGSRRTANRSEHPLLLSEMAFTILSGLQQLETNSTFTRISAWPPTMRVRAS
jgi:hypothetical protein